MFSVWTRWRVGKGSAYQQGQGTLLLAYEFRWSRVQSSQVHLPRTLHSESQGFMLSLSGP